MPDTLEAAPAQHEIAQPLSDTGESILSSIFSKPVTPNELSSTADPVKVKEALGDKFQDGGVVEKKKKEDDEASFTKEFEKKDEDDKKDEVAKSDDKKKEEDAKSGDLKPKTDDKPPVEANKDDDEEEAKGKIKNINDARKFYKESKKKLKESGEKLTVAEKELKEAREELAKLKDAPKPDAAKIAEQEKEVAELRAEREFVKKQAEELEQRAAAYSIQDTEPFQRLVTKPLERMGADLEELASGLSDEKDDQIAFMQAVGAALRIEEPKARRKALEEVAAPLTSLQQAELIQLAKEHKGVMEQQKTLMGNSQKALEIIKAKQEMDRKEYHTKATIELQTGAKEAREELKKMYKFFERTDLPDSYKAEIKELEDAVEKIDPLKLPPKEVGKIIEGYYRMKILNKAAAEHIAGSEKTHKEKVAEFEKQAETSKKEIEALNAKIKEYEAKNGKIESLRPNLGDGNNGDPNTEPQFTTVSDMVSKGIFGR